MEKERGKMNLLLISAIVAVFLPFLNIFFLPLAAISILAIYFILHKKIKAIELALSILVLIFIFFSSLGLKNHVDYLANYVEAGQVELILEVIEQTNSYTRVGILNFDRSHIKGTDTILLYTDKHLPQGTILRYVGDISQFRQFRNPANHRPLNIYRFRSYGHISESKGQLKILHIGETIDRPFDASRFINNKLSTLSNDSFALAQGVLLGNRSQLESTQIQDFKESGLIHITAVSGLHIGIIFMVFRLLSKSFLSKKLSILVGYIGAIFFTLVVGFRPSTLRAIMMLGIFSFAEIKGYPYSLARALQVTALFNIMYNPFILFDLGFQFSYGAVLGIVYLAPKIKFTDIIPSKYIANIVKVTLAIQLAIFPLNFIYNRGIPLLTPIANLLIAPVLAPYLTTLLLHVFLPFPLLILPIELISYYILAVSNITSHWINLSYITVLAVLIIFLTYIVVKKLKGKKAKFFISSILLLLLISIYLSQPQLQIHFLDVGQGDCAIIQYKGYNLMVDTGGIMGVDIGQRALIPTFNYLGINKIDYLFITHPHYDHFGALESIINHIEIERILFPDHDLMYSTSFVSILEKVENSGTELITIKKGDQLKLGDLSKIVLHPTREFSPTQSPANNISLVTLLEYRGCTTLFAGDIEAEAEKYLLQFLAPADILKVAHHGSATSSLEEFLEKVTPKSAIISVGNNRYGHPSKEVLDRLEQRDIEIFTTENNGMITVKIHRTGRYKIKSYVR